MRPIVGDPLSQQGSDMQADTHACDVCGSITVRSGTCYKGQEKVKIIKSCSVSTLLKFGACSVARPASLR
jgi:hypothetical protein